MQPTYLPWPGYFNLIASVDKFVFLDDVQHDRRSWQNRNRIAVDGNYHWLTVSVISKGHRQKELKDIEINDGYDWRRKHTKMIKQIYARHPYGQELNCLIDIILDLSITLLVDLTIPLIRLISDKLGFQLDFTRASTLGVSGKRSDHLLALCRQMSCDRYLSPEGSRNYLEEDNFSEKGDVQLQFQQFSPEPYPQINSEMFISHLSIIDLIANLGWDRAAHYVREGTLQ